MPTALRTPRINNNDDLVLFSHILSPPGAAVRQGDPVAEIETDKATFTIEAEVDGYILKFVHSVGEMIAVGSVLAWLGVSPDEIPPSVETTASDTSAGREPSFKASILLAKYGLTATDVHAKGERITAQDVLDFIGNHKSSIAPQIVPIEHKEEAQALAPGESIQLTVAERAMLKSVLWHRDHAVAAYLDIEYDAGPWETYAKAFQREHNLLMSPLLPLMAWRLVTLVKIDPGVNCTIKSGQRYQYSVVNLGFTVQSDSKLALISVKEAGELNPKQFLDRLTAATRRGMQDRLTPEDTTGVTVSFTSMARWKVKSHIPVLPPYTSLIVAHADGGDRPCLGATYDHRILTGGDVAAILRSLSVPPQ